MKILITGASGFIGGFLVEEALRRGYETWAGVRATSDLSRLQDKRIHLIDLRYRQQDELTDQLREFARTNGGWDYIIHNAGLTKTLDKRNFSQVNAAHTHHLIEALAAADCRPRKFLLMSSLSSYGQGDEKTFRPIRSDDPQAPNTAYGKSKLEAEEYLRNQTYFPYIILNPTGVYGPGEKDYFMEIQSIRSGFDFAAGLVPQQITFIYVKDLAQAAFLALENKQAVDRQYLVADGDVYTDEAYARLIQELLKKKRVWHARIPMGFVYIACQCSEWIGKCLKKEMTLNSDKYKILKQRNWICDTTPIQKELGFLPAYPLRRGLEESIAWYREAGWL